MRTLLGWNTPNIRWSIAACALVLIQILHIALISPTYEEYLQQQHTAAMEQWANLGITSYDLTVTSLAKDLYFSGIATVQVRDGIVVSFRCDAVRVSCAALQRDVDPIQQLFTLSWAGLNGEGNANIGCMWMAYNPVYGFPTASDNEDCDAPRRFSHQVAAFTPIDTGAP